MAKSREPAVLEALRKLAAAWPGSPFGWDDRFRCVVATFGAGLSEQARKAVRLALPLEVDAASLAKGPPELQRVAQGTGSLRRGQLLFGAPEAAPLVPFGLWWPWDGGSTVSLRVGFHGLPIEDANVVALREIFGATS